ncbi:hypothetical protein V494_06410 [Pseudogymnoascus sp. VKM F-4513 (FW-928)]|nr:hypothetical protein V494_06410 [Pseudogymnoascus sp. VKM F-4513 (FW-928)]
MAGLPKEVPFPGLRDNYVEGDADDEYFDTHDDLSRQTTSTFTPKATPLDEVPAAESFGQVTGEAYASEVTATQQITDDTGKPTSQQVKVSQATGTITGQLPTPHGAKQVKVSGQVTEFSAAEESAGTPGDQTPRPGLGSSTPRSTRSIRQALSAMLDGSPFRSLSSNSVPRPNTKFYEELDSSRQTTPKPKPRSQTAADPPRPPMDGYEWVWYPAGYWAERETMERPKKSIRPPRWVRRSLQESGASAQASPIGSAPRSMNPSEVWAKNPEDVKDDERGEDEEIEVDGLQRRRASTPPGTNSPDREASTPKTLLQKLQKFSHSRKTSGASGASKGKEPEEPRPESPPLERQTTNTLRGASSFFAQFLARKRQSERARHPYSPDERAQTLRRKRFGLAPWHQNDSGDTVPSVTSSLREMLFGKTPASTPKTETTPGQSKPDQYFGVEVPGSRNAENWIPPTLDSQQSNTPRSPGQGAPERGRQPAAGSQAGDYGPSNLFQPKSGGSMLPPELRTESAQRGDGRGLPYRNDIENFTGEVPEHFSAEASMGNAAFFMTRNNGREGVGPRWHSKC